MYNSKQDLIENILVKLDLRLKSVQEIQININNINNLEEVRNTKKDLNKFFFEVEDEIRQSIQIIKALLIQNKDISEQLEEAESMIQNQDRTNNFSNDDCPNNKVNNLLRDNQKLQEDFNYNEQIIMDLKEKLSMYSNQIKLKTIELEKNEGFMNDLEKTNFNLTQENKILKEEIMQLNNKQSENNQINSSFNNYTINTVKSNNEFKKNPKLTNVQTFEKSQNPNESNIYPNNQDNNSKINSNLKYTEPANQSNKYPKEYFNNPKFNDNNISSNYNDSKRGNYENKDKQSLHQKPNEKIINEKELFNNMVNEYLKSNQVDKKPNFESKVEDFKNNDNTLTYISKNDEEEIQQAPIPRGNTFLQDSSKIMDKTESKIGKVTNLVLKINNSSRLLKYCSERFGKDFLDKLLNPDTSENLIDPLEEFIYELENNPNKNKPINNHMANYNYAVNKSGFNENFPQEYNQNEDYYDNHQYVPNLNSDENQTYPMNYNQNYKNNYTVPVHEVREEDEDFLQMNSVNNIHTLSPNQVHYRGNHQNNNSKYASLNYSNIISPYHNNYAHQGNQEFRTEHRKSNTFNTSNKKIFNNYTKPYGHYFDPKYQYGGASKLEENKSGRRKENSVNNSTINKSKSIPRNNNIQDQSRVDFEQHKKVAEYRANEWVSTKEFFTNDSNPNFAIRSPDKVNNNSIHRMSKK